MLLEQWWAWKRLWRNCTITRSDEMHRSKIERANKGRQPAARIKASSGSFMLRGSTLLCSALLSLFCLSAKTKAIALRRTSSFWKNPVSSLAVSSLCTAMHWKRRIDEIANDAVNSSSLPYETDRSAKTELDQISVALPAPGHRPWSNLCHAKLTIRNY